MTGRRRTLVLSAWLLVGATAVCVLRGPSGSGPSASSPDAVPQAREPAIRTHVAVPAQGASPAPLATATGVAGAAPPAAVVPGRTLLLTDLPPRAGDPAAIARDLLEEHRADLGLEAMPGELVVEREMDTLSAHHLRLVQSVHGVPVFGSRVSAHVGHDGRPLMLRADVYPVAGIGGSPAGVTPDVPSEDAASHAAALLADDDDDDGAGGEPSAAPRVTSAPRLVILPRGKGGVLAWHVGVRSADETLRVFVDARDGAVLRADDVRIAAEGRALVFRPNPVHSSGNGSLDDQNDREQAALTNQLELVTLPRLDGLGYLVGQWADLRDSPVSTFRTDLDWTFANRSHHAFEQVMAYYHVDRVQDRLQSLGLRDVNEEAQKIDAHATKQDQSYYDVFDDRLEFGDGGVDDAEDADVIVHEYGHAIQFDQVGEFGLTGEGGAMGEGFGDFLAVVFHESVRPNWDPLFASWDATGIVSRDPPYLRRVDRNKVFPDDYEDQVHDDGEIWSRFLMDLRYLIGADDALRVVIESHFYLTPNARFREGCDAVLVANIALREGRDDASIRTLMDARGLPYLVPDAPLPPEEESEENDDPESAAQIEEGVYERLLLADEDWFRIDVPPFRRLLVRADHDPARLDLDMEAFNIDGTMSAASHEVGGVEEVSVSTGSKGKTVFLRCFHAPGRAPFPGAYDLTVTETDLEALGPVQTVVRDLQPGETWAFRVSVDPTKADGRTKLKLRTKKQRRGAKTDLQLFDPDGVQLVTATGARKGTGGKAKLPVDASGDWIGVVTPREGQLGGVKLKIKLK